MGWSGFKFSDEKPEIDLEDPYKDPVALVKHREYEVRRKTIDIEKAKILRDKLKMCYYDEGVNSYKNCRELATQYLESIKGVGISAQNAGKHDLGRAEARAKIAEG